VCCPHLHYGLNCDACPGFPDNICNQRGYCDGNGTTSGSGKCVCEPQFGGKTCEKCGKGYFQVTDIEMNNTNNEQPICEKCDASCGQCRGRGSRNCVSCRDGYVWDQQLGCFDMDECVSNPCVGNTFCINTEGSHYCYKCDKACDGCDGDGPDTCLKCALNHDMKDGVCVDREVRKREEKECMARYATYIGLCIATFIILKKNLLVASIVGAAVAIYISLSELSLKNDSSSYSLGKLFM